MRYLDSVITGKKQLLAGTCVQSGFLVEADNVDEILDSVVIIVFGYIFYSFCTMLTLSAHIDLMNLANIVFLITIFIGIAMLPNIDLKR